MGIHFCDFCPVKIFKISSFSANLTTLLDSTKVANDLINQWHRGHFATPIFPADKLIVN